MCIASAVQNRHVYSSNQKETRCIFMYYDIARKIQARQRQDIQFMRHKMSRMSIPRKF